MKLTMVIEATQDPRFLPRIIPLLTTMPLGEMVQQAFVADLLPPLLDRHRRSIELLRGRTESKDGTVFFDVTDQELEGYNKFIPYYLYPDCRYNVSVLLTPQRSKISVGFNPWSPLIREHNIAKICERYGGGGHPVVGAISLGVDELDEARRVAREIAEELRRPGPGATSMLAPPPGFEVPE